jgi:hypothetical protein
MLERLKIDLGITTNAYDDRLSQYLDSAERMIRTEGADIDLTDPQDEQIVIMYAAWLWRKRDSQEGMPRMLRWVLNNRIMQGKMN